MLAYPVGQEETQAPFRKIPLAQAQTPFTDREPVGQVLTQPALDRTKPFRHEVQTA
jgi:hypothetical protein